MNRKWTEWTVERVARLKQLVAEGVTTEDIAERMHITVSAVCHARRKASGVPVKPSVQFPWNTEQTRELRALVDDGVSNVDIAEHFGLTRNAIIGKKSRLKLGNKDQRRVSKYKPPPKPPEIEQDALRLPGEPTEPLSTSDGCFQPEHSESSPVPSPAPHSFCNYPFGDIKSGNLRWCGLPVQEGSSYCPEHHTLCHSSSRNYTPNVGGVRWR